MEATKGYWFATESRFTPCYLVEHSVKDVRACGEDGEYLRWEYDPGEESRQKARKAAEAHADMLNGKEVA